MVREYWGDFDPEIEPSYLQSEICYYEDPPESVEMVEITRSTYERQQRNPQEERKNTICLFWIPLWTGKLPTVR